MDVTIHFSPDIEAKLMAESARTGKRPEDIVAEAIAEGLLDKKAASDARRFKAWQKKFDAFLATMPRGNPDADFSRDKIYEGRGE
jgi:hypothetical protein